MARRRSRRKPVHLERAKPSEKFLAHGPSENEIARARIARAGEAVARGGRWPTLKRVEQHDRKIAPATLGRNSSALDPARRIWMNHAATALVTAGEFPTLKAIQGKAGAVRLRDLAKVEDAIDDIRRAWVAEHGPHPEWTDPGDRKDEPGDADANPSTGDGEDASTGVETAPAKGANNVDTSLLQKRIDRLMEERKKDRETIKRLTAELAEEREKLRRAMLPIIQAHDALNPSAPKPASPGQPRRKR